MKEPNLHSNESLFLNKATSLDHGPVVTDGRQPFAMPEVVVLEYSVAGAHVRSCWGVRKVVVEGRWWNEGKE